MSIIDKAKKHDRKLAAHPSPKIAVVTCVDSRLSDLPEILLRHADIDVIRTGAPAVTADVFGDIVVSTRVFGTTEIMLTMQRDLPDSVYAFPKQRNEPLTDAQHVRNAVARFDQVIDVSDADRALALRTSRKLPTSMTSTLGRRPGTNWAFIIKKQKGGCHQKRCGP